MRDFCADRPGLDTPACTVDAGHVVVELGAVDWTREQDVATRVDTVVAGDALVRAGLTETLEAQIGWTGFGTVRTRDRVTGAVERRSGTGDVTLALRRNLSNPDGSGFSLAVMPYATLPTGGRAIGAGDWSTGLIVPVSYSLTETISVAATPSIAAEANESGTGRHAAYGSVLGIEWDISKKVSTTLEVQATRDDDPEGRTTQTLASLSFAWQPRDGLQFDMGAVAGLNHDSPDVELYCGIARRF
ncbi:transporter [Sphingomonas sp. CJ20]